MTADREALRRELAEAHAAGQYRKTGSLYTVDWEMADAFLPVVERAVAAGQAQALTEAAQAVVDGQDRWRKYALADWLLDRGYDIRARAARLAETEGNDQ